MKNDSRPINDNIQATQVRLVDNDGQQMGIKPFKEALELASSQSLDLVQMSDGNPPVCKIMNWGKEKFRQQKVKHASKLKQKTVQVKELQLRPVTGDHDINIKLNQAKKFISKGNKVKFVMKFRGREMTHVDFGMNIMNNIINNLEDIIQVDQKPKMNGNSIIMMVSPK